MSGNLPRSHQMFMASKLTEAQVRNARECCLEELDLCSPAGKYVGDVLGDEEAPSISRLLRLAAKIKSLHLRGRYGPGNDISRGLLWNRTLTKLCIHGLNSDPAAPRVEVR
jgi:hypothetical protein